MKRRLPQGLTKCAGRAAGLARSAQPSAFARARSDGEKSPPRIGAAGFWPKALEVCQARMTSVPALELRSAGKPKRRALPAAYLGRARVCRASPVRFENVRPSGAHGVCIFEHVAEARREERSKRRELRRLAALSFLSSLLQGMSADARRNEWRRSLAGVWPLSRLCLLARARRAALAWAVAACVLCTRH